jgi:hypothetical protein
MPLQERNLFVAMKQERFAGRDPEAIKYGTKNIFLVSCTCMRKGEYFMEMSSL